MATINGPFHTRDNPNYKVHVSDSHWSFLCARDAHPSGRTWASFFSASAYASQYKDGHTGWKMRQGELSAFVRLERI